VIEPNTHCQLRFSYRAEGVVSGGRPNFFILDARDDSLLGQAGAFLSETGWRDITIDFVSTQSTEAVEILLRRDRCEKSPCPIFGRVWLDGFALQKK
jgi:hypothetical protein